MADKKREPMDDEKLLSQLQAMEDDSAAFVWGTLGADREKAMREYARMPYGNEEEGWSSIVTSEVQDTVEWVLPALLKVFTSTDRAVSFDPTKQQEVQGAEQATDACNYVFYKQNNGFLVLYTAFKDALTVKNCALMWRKEKKRVKNVTPVKGASPEMLAMIMQEAGDDAEIESATQNPPQPLMGPQGPVIDPATQQPVMAPPTIDARICSYEEKTSIAIECFPPEDLLIRRDWTSPELDGCPYVSRIMRVTLSDIHEMGFTDVEADDLAVSQDVHSADASFRAIRAGDIAVRDQQPGLEDESLTQGVLRLEYVLVDYDGDGIAERRCIYRLKDKILSNEECDQVPIATASPILMPHRWDGMSLAEVMSDLQQLGTELTRQMLNSAYLANNPRTEVLTDANWSPQANIDDLLDSRPGAILRKKTENAISQNITPWAGGQMFPMLEYVRSMGERRSGVSPQAQMSPDAIRGDRTAKEVQVTANAMAARVDLIARIFAELLLKPVFKGVLKLLTDGEMEKIAFRLRGEFVEYDPNEWRDSYDMTINVGLGTGDKDQQSMLLQAIHAAQGQVAASPIGPLLLKPKNIYHTLAKQVENAGFKNIGDFWQDPGDAPFPPPQQPPQDPTLQKTQIEWQARGQMQQAELAHKAQLAQMEAQFKAATQQADRQHEAQLAQVRAQMQAQVDMNRDRSQAEQNTLKMQQAAQLAQLEAQYKDAAHQREMTFQQWKVQFEGAVKIESAEVLSKNKVQDAATAEAAQMSSQGMQGSTSEGATP
jgi:hypothetical protein